MNDTLFTGVESNITDEEVNEKLSSLVSLFRALKIANELELTGHDILIDFLRGSFKFDQNDYLESLRIRDEESKVSEE